MSVGVSLPCSVAGGATETAGFVECKAAILVDWLIPSLGTGWSAVHVGPRLLGEMIDLIPAGVGPRSKFLVLDVVDSWTLLLSDGPLGTDLGVIPSRVARDLHVGAIRATAVDADDDSLGAAVLEVFDPQSSDRQFCRRSVFAADDGGRWRFGEFGSRFEFEDVQRYARRSIRERFTPDMVRTYLDALGAPRVVIESELSGHLVERM